MSHLERWACFLAVLIAALSCPAAGVAADSALLRNGSFEEGQESPLGWTSKSQSQWPNEGAHRGRRFVRAASDDMPAWVSETIAIEPGTDYRLAGWLRSPAGEGRLAIELIDVQGNVARRISAPVVSNVDAWRYVAMEFAADAASAQVSFRGKRADLDDVSLTPVAVSYLGNRELKADGKGRISLWSEEKDGAIAPGNRGGTHQSDPAIKRRELATLALESTGDWYAVSSVNYGVPSFTEKTRLSGWTRTEQPAAAQILACWMDDAQKVLRVDASDEARGGDWQPITLSPEAPPSGAHTVRLVALVRGGRAWFDDLNLLHLRPTTPIARLSVNQVGYELAGPKSAVVATNFFPPDSTTLRVQVIDAQGKAQWSDAVACQGRIYGGTADDWGWYFWRADFSDLKTPGVYRAVTSVGEKRMESFPFAVERGAVLGHTAQSAVDFFYIQRCGCEVPGWHPACHLDDATLSDGTHVDVTGGWHSAGDYNKPMWQFGDSGAAFALATAYSGHAGLFDRFNRDNVGPADALDEAAWGAAFLAKMQNPSDGSMRGDVLQGPARTWMKWSAPEVHTDNKIGTADDPVIAPGAGNTPLAIAAWAILARTPIGPERQTEYRARAGRLWAFLTAGDAAVANPLLLVGTLELYRTTEEAKYRDFARRSARRLLDEQKPNGAMPGDSGDHGDFAAAAVSLFALQFKDDPIAANVAAAMRRYLDFAIARTDNPFGVSRQGIEEVEPLFFHPTVGMGVNFWILGRAWSALLVHRLTHDERALGYAADQIDWVLGKNPLDLCMFEGHGGRNPPRYHHRYNMIAGKERGAVPGAIPNGFVRDMGIADRAGFDMSRAGGRSPSFRTSEPWLVHNMFYLLAVTALDEAVNARPH